jgi:acetate kinase
LLVDGSEVILRMHTVMKILVINCGSSSVKYQLHDVGLDQVLAKGIVARIGEEGSSLKHQARDRVIEMHSGAASHGEAFEVIRQALLDAQSGVISSVSEISAVGHRVVHGGETFVDSVLITDDVVAELEKCIPLAPLHNPANLIGIREAKRSLPDIPHVAVFDTAFHQTLPPKAYLYALPYEIYETHRVRRYGFHGTSYRYVSQRAAALLGKPLNELKMIMCHFGNGVSMAALAGGKSVDTSMGLTPLEGLIMGTRSGDVDSGVVFFLHRELGLSIDRIEDMLNRQSGLLGISGASNDMRDVIRMADEGNQRCRLALEAFAYRSKKYVGGYAAVLGGLDALVFTAGIGENSPLVRRMICDDLEHMGISLDETKNEETIGVQRLISTPTSRTSILVVPTDEERVIVMDTLAVAGLAR